MKLSITNLQVQDSFLEKVTELSKHSAPKIYKEVGWNRQQWNYFKGRPEQITAGKLSQILKASGLDKRTFSKLVFK